jgi:hypothetical protein
MGEWEKSCTERERSTRVGLVFETVLFVGDEVERRDSSSSWANWASRTALDSLSQA